MAKKKQQKLRTNCKSESKFNTGARRIEEASRAVAETVKLCKPKVVSIYPIMPQTSGLRTIMEFSSLESLNVEVVRTESAYSAISAAIGASAAGVRTYTVASSQGLKLMSEMLFVAAGMRLPIVMMVDNRALPAPANIGNDHSDSISERDAGWIQIYVESSQEAVDRVIQLFKISEQTLIPSMLCMDGFVLTQAYENVEMPSQEQVNSFLPEAGMLCRLSSGKLLNKGFIAPPESYMQIKKHQQESILNSVKTIKNIEEDFANKFKRKWRIIEDYKTEDAEEVLVCMGTVCGTARELINELRQKGKKAGMIKVSLFRPFPKNEISKSISQCKKMKNLIVLDRAVSFGNSGPLYLELKDALFGSKINIHGYIAGLGGRDITKKHLEKAFNLSEERWLI
jgi:pyruvate ferredoxin oxidoreductase alpha subunit